MKTDMDNKYCMQHIFTYTSHRFSDETIRYCDTKSIRTSTSTHGTTVLIAIVRQTTNLYATIAIEIVLVQMWDWYVIVSRCTLIGSKTKTHSNTLKNAHIIIHSINSSPPKLFRSFGFMLHSTNSLLPWHIITLPPFAESVFVVIGVTQVMLFHSHVHSATIIRMILYIAFTRNHFNVRAITSIYANRWLSAPTNTWKQVWTTVRGRCSRIM